MSELLNLTELSTPQVLELLDANRIALGDLDKRTRCTIVSDLRQDGCSESQIARRLRCSRSTIERCVRTIRNHLAHLTKEITLDRMAGHLIATARNLQTKAIASGNYSLAWQIECQLIEKLQSLRLLQSAPMKFEGKITWSEIVSLANELDSPSRLAGSVSSHASEPSAN